MKRLMLIALLLAGTVAAQDLAGTIEGLYGQGLGSSTTVRIPNYGTHGVVTLISARLPAAEARDVALPVFNALATQIGGTVSVSVHGSEGFGSDDYVLLFQMLDGVTSVYLNGEPFDP